jgi:hypothetical protein
MGGPGGGREEGGGGLHLFRGRALQQGLGRDGGGGRNENPHFLRPHCWAAGVVAGPGWPVLCCAGPAVVEEPAPCTEAWKKFSLLACCSRCTHPAWLHGLPPAGPRRGQRQPAAAAAPVQGGGAGGELLPARFTTLRAWCMHTRTHSHAHSCPHTYSPCMALCVLFVCMLWCMAIASLLARRHAWPCNTNSGMTHAQQSDAGGVPSRPPPPTDTHTLQASAVYQSMFGEEDGSISATYQASGAGPPEPQRTPKP